MFRPRLLIFAVAATLATLALGGIAVAAVSLRPTLASPNGKQIHAGRITLKVRDAEAGVLKVSVFVAISRKRATDKQGQLKHGCKPTAGCDFIEMTPWRHHPGWWIYRSQFNFPGYWAVTPDKYYWQAQNPDCFHFKSCLATSKVGSFRVLR